MILGKLFVFPNNPKLYYWTAGDILEIVIKKHRG